MRLGRHPFEGAFSERSEGRKEALCDFGGQRGRVFSWLYGNREAPIKYKCLFDTLADCRQPFKIRNTTKICLRFTLLGGSYASANELCVAAWGSAKKRVENLQKLRRYSIPILLLQPLLDWIPTSIWRQQERQPGRRRLPIVCASMVWLEVIDPTHWPTLALDPLLSWAWRSWLEAVWSLYFAIWMNLPR
jgi:hypothetical protein